MTHSMKTIRPRRGRGAGALRALDRDARTPVLVDLPPDAVGRIRGQHVVVIGVGSVGSHIADLLARSSVASLTLVDRGRIRPESILTHPVQPGDIGRPKATRAGEAAKAVSPGTQVSVFDGAVEDLPGSAFVGATVVLLASDNLRCELEVSQSCMNLGVPLIQASVHGPTLVAQVRALANAHDAGAAGPCLACDYRAADWEALDRGTIFSCAPPGESGESEDSGGTPQAAGAPTVSPPQLCATAACLAVTELMARVGGIYPAGESRQVETCGFTHRTTVTPLTRSADCPADHTLWRVEGRPARELRAATPHDYLAAVGAAEQERVVGASLTVAGYRFTRLATCGCSPHPVLGRFVRSDSSPEPCGGCGAPLECHPFYTHTKVPGLALGSNLDRSLGDLGVRDLASVLVQLDDQAVLFHALPRARREHASAPPEAPASIPTTEVKP